MNISEQELPGLKTLAMQYPSIQAASTAIINLQSELNLLKGTEHFVSDIHGEYATFSHVLKNGSGSIKQAIRDAFGDDLGAPEQHELATLIYYPESKISLVLQSESDAGAWLRQALQRLIRVCREFSSLYTRARIRQLMPAEYAGILEELLYEHESVQSRSAYYQSIYDSIIATRSAQAFVVALAELIQSLAVSRLHVIGDIYDRGPGAHHIMDALINYHSVDIQWGNHDIVWMGAAAGSEACIANVIRIALRYADLETLESGYAVSMLPLASFAMETYGDDPCQRFMPKVAEGQEITEREIKLLAQMQKAIAIIQLKLEGQIVQRRPQYQMADRLQLDKIDHARGTVTIGDGVYALLDTNFPTVDPNDPYALSPQEQRVVDKLRLSFTDSTSLQKHVRFLFSRGGMYLVHNGNLMYHGCVAMNADGSFKAFEVAGEAYAGKAFVDRVERLARQGYFSAAGSAEKAYGMDAMWYLWCGAQSPLFGKEKMATFERYFVAEKELHAEGRNAYYDLRNEEAAARKILQEFGVDPDRGRIINGHVPVKVRKGESPIKANGKLLVIDGGFSKAYRKETGLSGYTLIYSAHSLQLVAHQPFESIDKCLEGGAQSAGDIQCLETVATPLRVLDTDEGKGLQQEIEVLQRLLEAYRAGFIKER